MSALSACDCSGQSRRLLRLLFLFGFSDCCREGRELRCLRTGDLFWRGGRLVGARAPGSWPKALDRMPTCRESPPKIDCQSIERIDRKSIFEADVRAGIYESQQWSPRARVTSGFLFGFLLRAEGPNLRRCLGCLRRTGQPLFWRKGFGARVSAFAPYPREVIGQLTWDLIHAGRPSHQVRAPSISPAH